MKSFDNTIYHKYSFDCNDFNFNEICSFILDSESILGSNLSKCHRLKEKDNSLYQNICETFYSNDSFYSLYKKFISQVLKKNFGYTRIVYQRYPNIKIYYPGFHKFDGCVENTIKQNDSDTITIILPFTRMYDTNTIWLENSKGDGVLNPININYGEYLAFCQQNLMRDFLRNDTGDSSIFLEFMFTSYSSYKNTINSLILDSTANII